MTVSKKQWQSPKMVRMDAADAENGCSRHTDYCSYRRTVGS